MVKTRLGQYLPEKKGGRVKESSKTDHIASVKNFRIDVRYIKPIINKNKCKTAGKKMLVKPLTTEKVLYRRLLGRGIAGQLPEMIS